MCPHSKHERITSMCDGKHVCRQELDGGTAYLSASHLTDTGDPAADKEAHMSSSCERIAKIKAGSVVHFTEAMIHSGVSVLSERTRYAHPSSDLACSLGRLTLGVVHSWSLCL